MPMSENQVRFLLLNLKRAGYHDALFDAENDHIVPMPENPDLWMNGNGVCFKDGAGQDIRDLAHGPMSDIHRQTRDMLHNWQNARPMKITDVQNFRVLSEFGNVVLAARDDGPQGMHFVTWDYDPAHTGVSHGHYTTLYAGAKEDFAIRAGLIDANRLFEHEELALIRGAFRFLAGEDNRAVFADDNLVLSVTNKVERLCPELVHESQNTPDVAPGKNPSRWNDAFAQEYEDAELFGKPALFTSVRIDHATVPDGFYAYELSANAEGEPMTVGMEAESGYVGTVITTEPLEIGEDDYLYLGTSGTDDYAITFMGTTNSLDEFQYHHAPVDEAPQQGQQL